MQGDALGPELLLNSDGGIYNLWRKMMKSSKWSTSIGRGSKFIELWDYLKILGLNPAKGLGAYCIEFDAPNIDDESIKADWENVHLPYFVERGYYHRSTLIHMKKSVEIMRDLIANGMI
jgi:hypothetical protein